MSASTTWPASIGLIRFWKQRWLLGGMGPVNQLPSDSAKIFASAYALFSGLILIAVMGLVLSPLIHRVLHKFHVDEEDFDK